MSTIEILYEFRGEFAYGLKVTMALSLFIWTFGLMGGIALGTAATKWPVTIGVPSRIASFVLSGIPVLVFLFWLHYPAQYMLGVVVDPFYTSVVALSIVNILMVSETLRSVMTDFPKHYTEAARVSGFSSWQILRYVQFPIIWRQTLPGLLTIQIIMLQSTLFASLISVDEVFRIAQRLNSQIYRPVEIYSALGIIFLVICLPMHGIVLWIRKKYTRNFSER